MQHLKKMPRSTVIHGCWTTLMEFELKKWIVCQPSEQFYNSEVTFQHLPCGYIHVSSEKLHILSPKLRHNTVPERSTPEYYEPLVSGFLGRDVHYCSLIWVQLHVPCLNLKPELREATRCNRRRAWCGELSFALWKWSFVICKILHHHWHSTRAGSCSQGVVRSWTTGTERHSSEGASQPLWFTSIRNMSPLVAR